MKSYTLVLIVVLMTLTATASTAHPLRNDPPCKANIRYPRTPDEMCGEAIVDNLVTQGIASISALAFGPDGSLYYARPATSEIVRLKPDGRGFFEVPQIFATNLPEPPNGLTYADGAWYVSGDTTILRLRDQNGDGLADNQQILVHDLPGGAGGWLGNIHVGPDHRLYVAKASSCESCTESDPRRASLLSFALDGSDPKVVARGLKDSYDFAWNPATGTLYIVDNERTTQSAELNILDKNSSSAIPDFGWPRCGKDCAGTVPPAVTFDAGSAPRGIVYYQGTAFPAFQGNLLVTLAGSWNAPTTVGHALMLIPLRPDGQPNPPQQILPYNPGKTLSDTSLDLTSFSPDHPGALAISPEGWIYIAMPEGRIYRFRPRS